MTSKIVKVEVFKYAELSDDVKERLRDEWRSHSDPHGERDYWDMMTDHLKEQQPWITLIQDSRRKGRDYVYGDNPPEFGVRFDFDLTAFAAVHFEKDPDKIRQAGHYGVSLDFRSRDYSLREVDLSFFDPTEEAEAFHDSPEGETFREALIDAIKEDCEAFTDWAQNMIREDIEWLMSDEQIDESIEANEHEGGWYFEDGDPYYEDDIVE